MTKKSKFINELITKNKLIAVSTSPYDYQGYLGYN
jgi:hypothetical protein